jgi:uncharacterized BrkB/YihY/UPF0761 family membrane protein
MYLIALIALIGCEFNATYERAVHTVRDGIGYNL